MSITRPLSASAMLLACLIGLTTQAQTLTQAYIDAGYSIFSLGSVTGLVAPYGGLTIRPDQPNTLWIGDRANTALGAIHSVPLTRDAGTGRITGFAGPAALHAPAPFIDGGLHFAPNGTLLYTRYPSNRIGQVLPNGDSASVYLPPVGSNIYVGSLMMVPWGFPGAGNLVLASYVGTLAHLVPYSYDAQGYLVPEPQTATASLWPCNGPEGLAAVPMGSPGFAVPSILACSFSSGRVYVFEADASGMPIAGTGQLMITGLAGAEGAVIDPLTGDFLFSTFSNAPAVYRVSGFSAPSSVGGETDARPGIQAWPNPATSSLMVRCADLTASASLDLRSADGRSVRSLAATGGSATMDVSGLPAGLYILQVRQGTCSTALRIAIE